MAVFSPEGHVQAVKLILFFYGKMQEKGAMLLFY
jgi:hypothetical protein